MLNSLLPMPICLAASSLADWYEALATRNPMIMFPLLFVILLLLGWAAGEIAAEKDPVRSHQRHKAKQKSHTLIRL